MRRLLSCSSALVLVLGLVLGLTVVPSPETALAQTPSFSDSVGNAHEDNIRRLAERNVTRGCAEDRFCPEAPVTRQEMATFLARALELPTSSGPSRFNDVTNAVHSPNIDAIADAGITTGVTGNCSVPTHGEDEEAPQDPRFCPLDPVSRNQMAVFLERAFDIETARPVGLEDVDQGAFHAPAIGAALAAGITKGCSPGDRYCGGNDVKRGQMASFLMRALDAVGRSSSCPATSSRQPQVLDIATQGFPVNSAVADEDNDRLYLFTNALSPQQLVVVELSSRQVLANITVPGAGTRVWASTIAGDHLYFGRWSTGEAHNFYRIALADLTQDATAGDFESIGTGGIESGGPLDNRTRNSDGEPSNSREFWALTSDDQGRVYAGTGRQDTIYRFTPPEVDTSSTGTVVTAHLTGSPGDPLPPVPTDGKREVTALAWTPSGLVVGTGRGQGLARLVDHPTLDLDPGAGSEVSWPSRAIDLGYQSDGIVGIYASAVRQPTQTEEGEVLLTTEEDRARVAQLDIPRLLAGGAPQLANPSDTYVRRVNVDEPILHAPAFAPNGNAVAVGSSTTRLYESTNNTLVQRGTPVPASVTRSMTTVGSGLLGVTANGTVWHRDTASADETSTTRLESSPLVSRGPERPQSLTAARIGNEPFAIVGGNNKVTVHALPAANSTTPRRPAQDVTMPGEAKTVLAEGGTIYAATYPGGQLRKFTVNSTTGAVSDSELVTTWGDAYNRPRDMAYDARNQRLVIVAKSDFEGYGGIISVKRDGSGKQEWPTENVLSPGNVASVEPLTVAVTPDGTAVIGTPNGYVTGFDHVNGRKLWEVRPTGASVRGLTVTADGTIHGLATDGTRFTIVDGPRGVATTSPFRDTGSNGGASSLLTGSAAGQGGQITQVDGQLVAATTTRLVAIDPGTGAEKLLYEGAAPATFTSRAHAAAVPGSGCQDVLTYGRGNTSDARVTRAPVLRP